MCEHCNETQIQLTDNNTAIDLTLMDPIIEKYGKIKGSLINILKRLRYMALPLFTPSSDYIQSVST